MSRRYLKLTLSSDQVSRESAQVGTWKETDGKKKVRAYETVRGNMT